MVSRLDHDANVRPWIQAAARADVTVRWAEVDISTGELPAAQYGTLLSERTRLVAVTAASNILGTRPDVAAITASAHGVGALTYVDGVHATPHTPVDVRALGADFYATSAYKWSGPAHRRGHRRPGSAGDPPARTSSPPRRTPCRNDSSWAPPPMRTWPG